MRYQDFHRLLEAAEKTSHREALYFEVGGCGILISRKFAKRLEYRRIDDWNVTIAVIIEGSED